MFAPEAPTIIGKTTRDIEQMEFGSLKTLSVCIVFCNMRVLKAASVMLVTFVRVFGWILKSLKNQCILLLVRPRSYDGHWQNQVWEPQNQSCYLVCLQHVRSQSCVHDAYTSGGVFGLIIARHNVQRGP